MGGVTSGLVTPDTPLVLLLPKSDYILPSWLAGWLAQFALLASMWALLQPHFLAVRPGKIVLLLGALSLVSRKLLPNPWPARRLVMT